MKKLRLLPLFLLMLFCLCSSALADWMEDQQDTFYITDGSTYVSALTDNNTATVWTKSGYGHADVDLTITLYNANVGEIWIRNGHAYSNSYYNHFDRPAAVKVTIHYYANQYSTSYDTFRYQLTDSYSPYAVSKNWNNGYQRLLLPKQYRNVTKIELTVESVIGGYGQTGATITDLRVAEGSHATATPRAYATATPRPYNVYVTATPDRNATATPKPTSLVEYITPRPKKTPTPEPLVEVITPRPKNTPTSEPLVEVITPKPTATPKIEVVTARPGSSATLITPKPTEPLVELITPEPIVTADPEVYPSKGVIIPLLKSVSTRSGPGTRFDEPGTFLSAGDPVNVLSKAYDGVRYWYQIEFQYKDEWYRVYTTESYLDIGDAVIPTEPDRDDPLETVTVLEYFRAVAFGPGEEYALFTKSALHEGNKLKVFSVEGDWVQVEYTDYGSFEDPQPLRRGWVPYNIVYEE